MLYLDSSAIVKLVVSEPETPQLVATVRADPAVISSVLAWTEVMRAVRRAAGPLARARRVLDGIALVPIDDGIVHAAGDLRPPELRTLDALHLATALSTSDDLSGLVTYDDRLGRAAIALGLDVLAPSPDPTP